VGCADKIDGYFQYFREEKSMKPMIPKSFQDLDNGEIDRRQLIQALGLTAGAAFVAGSVAYAQESNVPRMKWLKSSYPRSGPFKTLSVGHISYSVPDYKKARAWYIDLLGMQSVFDNGTTSALRFGIPWNHIYLGQNGDPNAKAAIGHMAYSIEKFRLDAVEAELKARGLVALYDGPEMIHTDDPEGYRLQPSSLVAVFPGGGSAQAVDDLKQEDGLKAELRAVPRPTYRAFTASCMNHISHNCVDYGKVRDYYVDVWGMRKVSDDGNVAVVEFGGEFGDPPQQVWLRGGLKSGETQYVDHVGYSIEDFDSSRVEAELTRRGLNPKRAGANAWAISDVAGFPIQICAERGVIPGDAYSPYA
jgi:catechol 2,3-dioxygenase-like lactoylglutathione lyase family enzyme